jgi:hypothetical protein
VKAMILNALGFSGRALYLNPRFYENHHSKDNAPELNQVVLQLICANKSSIPLWIEVLSGNANDKKSFKKTVKEFQKQFDKGSMPYLVADSAFYTQENLADASRDIRWVTRVPETVKEVGERYAHLDTADMTPAGKGYRYLPVRSTYAGVPQRRLVVFSEQAALRELKTFGKSPAKEREKNEKEMKHLRNREFACEKDARKAAEVYAKKLRHQRLSYSVVPKEVYPGKGRPKKTAVPERRLRFVTGVLEDDRDAIERTVRRKGMFVIATNELDETAFLLCPTWKLLARGSATIWCAKY